jgi:hypothetical protein
MKALAFTGKIGDSYNFSARCNVNKLVCIYVKSPTNSRGGLELDKSGDQL